MSSTTPAPTSPSALELIKQAYTNAGRDLNTVGKSDFSYWLNEFNTKGKDAALASMSYGFNDPGARAIAATQDKAYAKLIGLLQPEQAPAPAPPPPASLSYGGIDAAPAYNRMLSGQVNTEAYNKVMDALRGRMSQNFSENIMPQLRSGAIASGQYGGSRQGIAEGIATRGLNQSLADAGAGIYGNAYAQAQGLMGQAAGQIGQFSQNQYSMDTNRMGTIGGLQIGDYNAQTNRFGTVSNAQNQFMNTQIGAANGAVNLGLSANSYPWQQLQNYSQIANSSGGMGNSSSAPVYSNPYAGAIGGALAGWQMTQPSNGSK